MRDAVPAQSAAAQDLLAGYATRFQAVELDSVFYRRPSPDTVESWRAATDDGFRFTVRVPREITHVARLGAPAAARDFVDSLGPLGTRLNNVLFTTPPTLECDVGRFERVLEALPRELRTAWEFRHPSWMCPEVLELLAHRGSSPVVVESFDGTSPAGLLPGAVVADRWEFPFLYVRFRRESYTYADLVIWGDVLGDVLGEGRDVYAFFRQSAEATAYATALGELLAEAKAATFSSTPVASFSSMPAQRAIQ